MYQPEQPVFDQAIESNIEITYGIEDVPKPWWKSLYFAVQITLVDFTPFVWGGMFVSLAGLDAATVLPTMISACFLVMGICTLIQTTIGNRLPIVQGPSASLASSMGSVAATYGLPAVWGSVIVGGALETLLGGARIMSKIRKFLPPVVVGSVVAAIGYVAARIAVQWTFSSQDAKSLIMAAVAFLLALVLKFRGGKGLLSQGFILITVIIVGVVGASALGVFNWEAVHNAPWFALPSCSPTLV
ncbi:MAG: solute carrier family 23 protein [Angelakisella sp.]